MSRTPRLDSQGSGNSSPTDGFSLWNPANNGPTPMARLMTKRDLADPLKRSNAQVYGLHAGAKTSDWVDQAPPDLANALNG